MKVIIPESPKRAGQATRPKPPIIRPLTFRCSITYRTRRRHQRAKRARRLSLGCGPVEAIPLAGTAEDMLCVLRRAALLPLKLGVIALGVDIGEHSLDRRQFILADAAVEDLL